MSELIPSIQECLTRIRDIVTQGRRQALQAVNTAMVQTYWQVGREIVEEEQRGANRAEYGARIVETLANQLTHEFGKGFDRSNLWNMRAVYMAFPILDAPRRELRWTHYRLLARVPNPQARAFYDAECASARWSTRELERQISTLLYERLAPRGTKQDARLYHSTGMRSIARKTSSKTRLCWSSLACRNRRAIRLYLPTEQELRGEIEQERVLWERERRLTTSELDPTDPKDDAHPNA